MERQNPEGYHAIFQSKEKLYFGNPLANTSIQPLPA